MRGKPVCVQAFAVRTRIIPAHAGQTMPKMLSIDLCTDHPRACGANHSGTIRPISCIGSSPRMRGKRAACHIGRARRRIIPAHAGQTSVFSVSSIITPDHPRACGANVAPSVAAVRRSGSSPRMRGKLIISRGHGHALRIIPAHAGQTMLHFQAV